MKNVKYLLALIAAVIISVNLPAQTVEQIIEKHVEALGGFGNMNAVKTIRVTGSAKVMGLDIPYMTCNIAPNKTYFEMSVQGLAVKQAYDGTTAWMINPMSGSKSAEVVEGDDAKNIIDRGNIFGKLTTYKEDGAKLELVGKDKVRDEEAYKLVYTDSNGKNSTYYISTKSNLVVKVEKKISANGEEKDSETIFSDYRKTGNVTMAYGMNTKVKNSAMGSQIIVIDKIEINPELDEAMFSMPVN